MCWRASALCGRAFALHERAGALNVRAGTLHVRAETLCGRAGALCVRAGTVHWCHKIHNQYYIISTVLVISHHFSVHGGGTAQTPPHWLTALCCHS